MSRARPPAAMPGAARGIGRSLRLYYGDAARTARMDALHAGLCPPGGLVFDIGAHVGDRTASFRRLGARVVAVEPQPAAMRALRLIHGRDRGVALEQVALSAAPGRLRLHLNTANPTVSTASSDFIARAATAQGWRGERWDGAVEVGVLTLDQLIARHGAPDFVKIDVEGFEDRVLEGLTRPLPSLSFEFTTLSRKIALAAISRLGRLGRYRFNVSLGERHGFEFGSWRGAAALADWLREVPPSANSGDIYARRC